MAREPLFGVNLPWFFGSYGHDLAVNEHHPAWGHQFDAALAERALTSARALGFDAVRVWLCEHAEGITTHRGRITGAHPTLSASLDVLQGIMHRVGVRAYWSLLDANSWKREGDTLTHAIVADQDATARFAERVAAPLARALDPSLTIAIEALNEPEVMSPECAKPGEDSVPWDTLGRALRTIGDAIRGERPGTLVTAGSARVFLPRLWTCGASLDAIDVHVYHDDGGLPTPAQLAESARDPRVSRGEIPLFAGECGMPDHVAVEEHGRIANYLHNAPREGYRAVFLWRLEGTLIWRDPEANLTTAGHKVRYVLQSRVR
jgi:hypothetical protein